VYVNRRLSKTRYKQIENIATCELRPEMRFLNFCITKPVDIHRQICEVYVENVILNVIMKYIIFNMYTKIFSNFIIKNNIKDNQYEFVMNG